MYLQKFKRLSLCLAVVGLLTFPTLPAFSQTVPGVTATDITIGSCSALDGPARKLGTDTVTGASAYFSMINDQGGVNGRKLKLVPYDDGYDPDKAQGCFNRQMKENAFALGFMVGTPTALKYTPLVEENKVPMVGLFTGAQALYTPVRHWVVTVRASYYDETREQVDNLWNVLGMKKIGVIYPEDAFGAAVLDGVKLALKGHNSQPVALGSYPRQTLSVDDAIAKVKSASPEAVVLVGPYAPVAEIVKRAHRQGWKPLFLTVSFVGTDEFIKEAGPDAEGTIITQVVPPYYMTDLPTVALYRRSMQKYFSNVQPSFVGLEGFVDAMVLTEGLKRAGKSPTRPKLIEGIESIHNMDVGLGDKLKLNYSATSHKGFHNVYATVVRGGKPVIFNDWSIVKGGQ